MITDEITNLIIDHELTQIGGYDFGKKKRYIVKSGPYSFTDDNIKKIMEKIDILKYINNCDNKIYGNIKNNGKIDIIAHQQL